MASDVVNGQIIDAFFEAISSGDVARCEELLAQLKHISEQQIEYGDWCLYFEGVLIKEHALDWAQAERIFQELLANSNLDLFLRGQVLLSLGNTYFRQGLWSKAIYTSERTLPIFSQLNKPEEQAKVWLQIALAYTDGFDQGDFGAHVLQNAITHCEQALAALKTIASPTRSINILTSTVWNTLGLAYRGLNNWNEAIRCFRQFLQLSAAEENRYYMAFAYCNLGEVYQRLGYEYWSTALDAYQNALTIFREFKDRYQEIEVLANLGFLHQERHEYTVALDYYAQTFQVIEQVRSGTTSEETRANFFATVAETYANAILTCLRTQQPELAFTYAEQARSRAFLDMLSAGSFELTRELTSDTMTLTEVQNALPENTILLEYFTTGLIETRDSHMTVGANLQRRRFPSAKTMIFAITRTSIAVHDTGLSPNHLYPTDLAAPVEEYFLPSNMRRALYNYLIEPCADWLQNKRCLYIVPHGPLHYVPFHALIAPDGETLLRSNSPQVVYAPSATILLRLSARREESVASTETESCDVPRFAFSCLAVGHNGDTGSTHLRFAEDEAISIAQLTDGQALVGTAANKAAIFESAATARLLHFSCHGTFDPASPLESALHLACGETLTAKEVLKHLHLHSNLVTLSACESGLSRVRRGDELFGLVRAFMYAGALALIVTQWRVDERSTRILMERFYANIQSGMERAEALRKAQLYLKELTCKEVLAILQQFHTKAAPTPHKTVDHKFLSGGNASPQNLDELTTDPLANVLANSDDATQVFADPYYWAPFILIETAVSEST